MKKQGVGGSAFFVGVGWLGLPAGAVWALPCRPPTGSCRASRADRLRTCMKKNTIQLSFGLL